MNTSENLELAQDLAQLQAEAIGWLPLEEGAYLHLPHNDSTTVDDVTVIDVVGLPDVGHWGQAVLLVGY